MNEKEIESLIRQLEAAGLSEEQIMETFYETFQEGKMDRKDLETLAEFMGYELTDEFKNDTTPDPIASGGGEGISEAQAEDLKEIKPGESAEQFQEKIDDAKEGDEPMQSEEPSTEESEIPSEKNEEVDEEKEWEEAQKKFKW